MTLDRDDDGVPLHDSEEGRAMSAARRLALRDAAPDLLAALREFLELSELAGDDDHQAYAPTMAKARAAIAKAGG